VVDFILAFFSSSENVTVKTLLKSVHIYQSYCKKNLAQFFFGPPCRQTRSIQLQKTVKTVTEHRPTDDSRSTKIPQFSCQIWCCSSVYTCTENIPQSYYHSCISSRYSPNTHSCQTCWCRNSTVIRHTDIQIASHRNNTEAPSLIHSAYNWKSF